MTPESSGGGGSRPIDPDFTTIMAAARVGQGWAFERLYGWLAPQVTGFAAVRGADDPEGVANEVFLKAFDHLHRFHGDAGSFRSWVFTIARHVLIDVHRTAARRPQVTSSEVPERRAEPAEDEAMTAIGLDRVISLLAVLSDDQRDVILLRMIADLSLAQVSVMLDKPVTAIKALQRRGLRRLQSEILGEMVMP